MLAEITPSLFIVIDGVAPLGTLTPPNVLVVAFVRVKVCHCEVRPFVYRYLPSSETLIGGTALTEFTDITPSLLMLIVSLSMITPPSAGGLILVPAIGNV